MAENPQWYADNQWRIWKLHLDEVVEKAYENPRVEVDFPIKKPSVIYEAGNILTDT